MAVQAKFYVAEVTQFGYMSPGYVPTNASGTPVPQRKVVLRATSRKDEASRKFWQATPSGTVEMSLSAESGDAAGLWFESRLGKSVLLTFEDAPEE